MLWQWVLRVSSEQLGGKCSHYLPGWREMCGGETFIALGMLCYWKDPVVAEQLCREMKRMVNQKFR
jgi:hypothetical protein